MTAKRTAQGIALIIASATGLFLLWRYGLHGIGAVLAGVGATLVGRVAYRSKLLKNPFGEDRNYSAHPVFSATIKAVACFIAAMLWAVTVAFAVRLKFLPDNELVGYGLLLVPLVSLFALGAFFLFKATFRAHFGDNK